MERRKEPRLRIQKDSTITVLGEQGFTTSCISTDVSRRGMRLVLCHPVPPGAAVKIETEDAVIFGEIMYCRPEPTGYAVGFKIDQVLRDLKMLNDLNRRLLAYGITKPQPEAAAEPANVPVQPNRLRS